MQKFTLNTASNSNSHRESIFLNVFNPIENDKSIIEEGMTIGEVSDLISKRLTFIIKEQFELTKSNFEKENTL